VLKDSLYSIENVKELNELRIKYETEKKEQENILLSKELELEKVKKKRVLYSWIGTIGLLVILTILFFLYRKNVKHRRCVLEQKKLLIESEKNQLEQEKKVKDLENIRLIQENQLLESQQEITAQKLQAHKNMLTSTNNFLLQQSQLTEILIDALKSLKPYSNREGKDRINTYLADLSGYSRDKSWQTFEQNLLLLYPDFLSSIKSQFPELTVAEYRLSAFIKFGKSTIEISKITMQSRHSIYGIKKRLREKMKLETNEELEDFIRNFPENME
jgi:DNA-binding CsgD family transcriptional regulator